MLLLLSAFFVLVCLLRPYNQRNTVYYTKIMSPIILWILGIKVIVENGHLLPTEKDEPIVLMSNHQNNYDALIVCKIFHWSYTIVGKKSIKYIPFFGWLYWLCGMALIDRSNRRAAHHTMNEIEENLAKKRFSLYLFPEGTRSHGKGVAPLKKGGFRTAFNLKRDLYPVVVSPYHNHLNQNSFRRHLVKIKVLDPIRFKDHNGEDMPQVIEQMHSLLANGVEELEQEMYGQK